MHCDSRLTASYAKGGLIVRRYSGDRLFVAEYNIDDTKSIYRAPVIKTIGRPEPGLPMKNKKMRHKDIIKMFSSLIKAIDTKKSFAFDGKSFSGSYGWQQDLPDGFVVNEMISANETFSVSKIQIDKMGFALTKHYIADFERKLD